MACSVSSLTRNLVNNCQPNGQGLKAQMYVGNLDQIQSVAFDADNKTITGITLKSGEKLKLWEGFKLSNQATIGFAANDYGNNLPHGLRFVVLDNSVAADKEVDSIVNQTNLFAIAKQNGATGRWKVFGYPTGLACTNLTNDSNDANTPGQFVLEFQAAQEKTTPYTLKHVTSSVEDTEAYLITLTTP
ncbi:hypothetical protein GCM10028807_32690 [Spirosoma daeguense]